MYNKVKKGGADMKKPYQKATITIVDIDIENDVLFGSNEVPKTEEDQNIPGGWF
jgi:hypothetical protein